MGKCHSTMDLNVKLTQKSISGRKWRPNDKGTKIGLYSAYYTSVNSGVKLNRGIKFSLTIENSIEIKMAMYLNPDGDITKGYYNTNGAYKYIRNVTIV